MPAGFFKIGSWAGLFSERGQTADRPAPDRLRDRGKSGGRPGPIRTKRTGRAASCTEGVIAAHLDQAPKVVVPGNGDRVWGTAEDHEMAYALPAAHLADLVEGLAKTHERGIRYPIPSYLRFRPEVALKIPLVDIL